MNRFKPLGVFLGTLLFISCNGYGSKDEVLARLGNSTLKASELSYAQGTGFKYTFENQNSQMIARSLLFLLIQSEAAKNLTPGAAKVMGPPGRLAEDRDLTQVFSQFYLTKNLGHTDEEIQAWFRKNQGKFRTSSGIPDLYDIYDSVVFRIVLDSKDAELRAFYDREKERFQNPDSVDLSILTSPDSVELVRAVVAIRKGASFDSIAKRIHRDSTLAATNGRIPRFAKGHYPDAVSAIFGLQYYLFSPTGRIPVDSMSPVMRTGNPKKPEAGAEYVVVRPTAYITAKPVTWEQIRPTVETHFYAEYRESFPKSYRDSLSSAMKLERQPIPRPDLPSLYKQAQSRYKTAKGFRLLHMEMRDSLSLAKLMATVRTEKDFRNIAASKNQNEITRRNAGDLGLVKVNHCLPAGLGMMPDLFHVLDGRGGGTLTQVLYGPDTKKWHAFWVLDTVAPQQKPFERVSVALTQELASGKDQPLDSNFILVRMNGKPVILESDVRALFQEIPEKQRVSLKREDLLPYLENWIIFGAEARKVGIHKSKQYLALSSIRSAERWAGVFQDSVLHGNLGLDISKLKQVWKSNPDQIFGSRTWDEAMHDVAKWVDLTDADFMREFALNPERYPDKKDWKNAKTQIFLNIKDAQFQAFEDRLMHRLQSKLAIKILDTSLAKLYQYDSKVLLAVGKLKYEQRDLVESKLKFQRVQNLKGTDTAAFRATILLAQIFNEEENFGKALDEYTVAAALWPNHPETYKALFMKGFILSENLKQDSLALPVFKELLQRFPKCELADDSEWMVRNIESGGALAPALLDRITEEEALPTP